MRYLTSTIITSAIFISGLTLSLPALAQAAGGYPDATNTGVPAGTALKSHSGGWTISTAGTVIDGYDISGPVYITAPNVTIKNSYIHGNGAWYTLYDTSSGLTVTNSTIDGIGTNNDGTCGIDADGLIALRNNVSHVENGICPRGTATVQDNYIHDLLASGSPHYDGIQELGPSNNQTITHNTIDMSNLGETGALNFTAWSGSINNVTSTNNRLLGGSYTVYYDLQGSTMSGNVLNNNRIKAGQFGYFYFTYTPSHCGNVDDVTGAALDSPCSGGDTTAPSTPANLAASAVSSSQINLTWTASTDNVGVTGYQVFRNGTQVGSPSTNSYNDTGLTASTAYSYTVKAVDAAGNVSAVSNTASATTQAGGGGGTWTYKQNNAASVTAASNALAFTSNTTAGDLVVAEVDWPNTLTFTSIADSQGNTWTQIGSEILRSNGTRRSRLYYAKNIHGGADTVTATISGSGGQELFISEYAGLDTVNPFDGYSSNTSSGSSFTSNNVTTTAANDLLYGMDSDAGNGSAAAGWTTRSSLNGNVVADKNAPTAGANAFTGSTSSGNGYTAWIAAFKVAGGGGGGDTTPPSIPTNLSASAISSSQINLTWTASTDNVGVTGYKIFRGGVQVGTSATNSFSNTGLTASTAYSYYVSAYDAAGNNSGNSNTASATTQAGTSGWTNVPFASQNGTFTASFDATPNQNNADIVIGLSQSAASSYASLATIIRFGTTGTIDVRNGGTYGAAATVAYIAGSTYHVREVVNIPAHTYSVYVKPPGGAETLLASNYAFRTEQAAVTSLANYAKIGSPGDATIANFTLGDTQAPTTPTNLSASAISSSQINLTWTASTDNVGVTGYKIFRGGVQVGTSATNSFSNTGLTASTAYSYYVSAYDAAGNNSGNSNSASGTTLPPPPTVVISAVPQSIGTGDSSTLSWTSTNATSCTGTNFSTGDAVSGSAVVTPAATTVYTVSCNGLGGTGTNTITVTVGALSALPTISFPSGTFTWTTTDAVSCTASGGWSGSVGTSGSYTFSTPVSTTYVLTCTGGGTTVQRTITITTSETATVSSKFQSGQTVTTASTLNVRSAPSTTGTLLGTQSSGASGTVTGGPVQANGYWWWQVNYATGPDGWSVENWLQ